jgi:hypothetical protein
LALDPRSGDVVTAVFTSKPNGLVEQPACNLGPPRSGYFVGAPGGVLTLPTWVDFNSLQDLDAGDLTELQRRGRMSLLLQTLPVPLLCAVLRCVLQCDDLTGRQARLVGDVAAVLRCPWFSIAWASWALTVG